MLLSSAIVESTALLYEHVGVSIMLSDSKLQARSREMYWDSSKTRWAV